MLRPFLAKLLVKVGVARHHLLHHVLRRQDGHSEMVRARALSKSRARDYTNALRLEQLHAVNRVWHELVLLAVLQKLFRHLDLWERIHRALDCLTAHAIDSIESISGKLSLHFQISQNRVLLALPLFITTVPYLRRIHDAIHRSLPRNRRAQARAQQLDHFTLDHRVPVDKLHVSAAKAALPLVSLAHGMKTSVLKTASVRFTKLVADLFEGMELTSRVVDVVLVHFVG